MNIKVHNLVYVDVRMFNNNNSSFILYFLFLQVMQYL